MKAIALFSALSWLLLGTSVGSCMSAVQYGALGLLGFVVVWFCLKGFPTILESHKAEVKVLKAAIDDLVVEIRVLRERIDR